MALASRQNLIDYALRALGSPVIEINIDLDQMEDRVDEAIQYWREYHADATVRLYIPAQITADDLNNEYITVRTDVISVPRVFRIASSFNTSFNFFDIKYQMMLNDIADMQNFSGDLAYYEQMNQYLSLLDMKLNGEPQVTYARHKNRLYLHGDLKDGDINEGDFIVYEGITVILPEFHSAIWDDMWLKRYTTALFKRQWGQNLLKFEGMQLPGGVTLNGRQLFEDAMAEIQKLEEEIRTNFELPPDFFVG